MIDKSSLNGWAPLGDGATIIELPHFKALIILLTGVANGLVEGTIAATTPLGLKYTLRPNSSSSETCPKDLTPFISRRRPKVLL